MNPTSTYTNITFFINAISTYKIIFYQSSFYLHYEILSSVQIQLYNIVLPFKLPFKQGLFSLIQLRFKHNFFL